MKLFLEGCFNMQTLPEEWDKTAYGKIYILETFI